MPGCCPLMKKSERNDCGEKNSGERKDRRKRFRRGGVLLLGGRTAQACRKLYYILLRGPTSSTGHDVKHAFETRFYWVLGLICDIHLSRPYYGCVKCRAGRRMSSCQPLNVEYPAALSPDPEVCIGTGRAMQEYNRNNSTSTIKKCRAHCCNRF